MDKRKVTFSNLIKLIKDRRPHSILGIVFVFSSVFILLPTVFFISSTCIEPYQKYDFDAIERSGAEQSAKITRIKAVNNVTINNEHPQLIGYEYVANGKTVSDEFQTMDLDKMANSEIGDEIKIKTLHNQSKIQGLKPFVFPIHFFYLLPLTFFGLGVPFLLIGLVPALREYGLYKNGVVREASVISVVPKLGLPISGIGQSLSIDYHYRSSTGEKIFAQSKTTDFTLLSLKTNDTINIFVSERDETKSCLIPKLEAMKNNWKI